MNFKLNDYHQNITDDELMNDVINTAKKLNRNTLTTKEYTKFGKYNRSTVTRRFGTWKQVLELCGLQINPSNFQYTISAEEIIADVKRVAQIYNKGTITAKEYDEYGLYNSNTLKRRYGNSWNNILKMCELNVTLNRNFSDKDLFEEIERVWILLGRQPTTNDIKGGISKYCLQSYTRRFGGWRSALQAFVDYINNDLTNENGDCDCKNIEVKKECKLESTKIHLTKRDINLRLRFKVMQRDNFKCCICGASPAKDPSIELHIDHIVPWSKGGETTIDNLQTLCSKCNLGKSDLL